jgi:Ca-activated chloride channel family protein
MTATDTEGISRNDAAKLLLREFINSRPTDRIGLISFAGDTFIETPVTRSRATLLKRVNQIQPGDFLVPGTDITSALEEAQNLLTEEPPPGSAIIVLSDGDNVTGGDPEKVLGQLKKSTVPIIAVAFGKDGVPANVPQTEMFTQSDHNTVKQLSQATNGLFISASPKEVDAQIAKLNTRVDTIELDGKNIAGELYERPQDIFVWPLTIALICLMTHILLPLRTKKLVSTNNLNHLPLFTRSKPFRRTGRFLRRSTRDSQGRGTTSHGNIHRFRLVTAFDYVRTRDSHTPNFYKMGRD